MLVNINDAIPKNKNRPKKRGGSSKKPFDGSFSVSFYFSNTGAASAAKAIALGTNFLDACNMSIVQKIKIFVTTIASDSKRHNPFMGDALVELTVVATDDIVLFSDLNDAMQDKRTVWTSVQWQVIRLKKSTRWNQLHDIRFFIQQRHHAVAFDRS